MNIRRWNPWDDLARVRERTERLWDEFLERISAGDEERVAFVPSADVVETTNGYRLYVAVPGFVEEDIAVTIVGERRIVVSGERLPEYDESCATNHTRELRYGFFERQFMLSQGIDATTLRANYESGMLTITVSKATSSASAGGAS